MSPRREPLLWIQCLALGAIPLELLLIRVLLAGADPGPVPGVERLLLWGVGAAAPAAALWTRPADWASLLVVRLPTAGRRQDQQRLSQGQTMALSGSAVVAAAVLLLPLIWWLDNSAVLVNEFSPVAAQSRLMTLLLSTPLLALIVWQLQQLIQAGVWLIRDDDGAASDASGDNTDLLLQRTSFGLQVLQLEPLVWPDPPPAGPAPNSTTTSPSTSATAEVPEATSVSTAVAVEQDEAGEEDESPGLDSEVAEVDGLSGGESEGHGEQAEPGGGEEGEPEGTTETPPGVRDSCNSRARMAGSRPCWAWTVDSRRGSAMDQC